MTEQEKIQDYMAQLRTPYRKLVRLRFLNPDGSTAFALDNNPENPRSGAFVADGSLSVNLQNGQRRTADVTLLNGDGSFDYALNRIWYGQEVALDMGLTLSDGSDFYHRMGVFLIDTPAEDISPGARTATYHLVDKWAGLDGTLYGRLEGTYTVAQGTNIFTPISALLAEDRGNGIPVDRVAPVCTEYYNSKTQALPDGSTASMADAPYTLEVAAGSGTIADVVLGLAAMVNGWVGYDNTGSLRIDPSQDDISDAGKPVLWRFTPEEAQLLGMSYTTYNADVFNDYIVTGERLDGGAQPGARAQNLDPRSDTSIGLIGRKTTVEARTDFYTATQCRDYAEWMLKRSAVLRKTVTIRCTQMFHLRENDLVEIVRTDKAGSPAERHLIQGFTIPFSPTEEMTIEAISVSDYPEATLLTWPLTETEEGA